MERYALEPTTALIIDKYYFKRSFFFFQAEDGIRYGHVTGVQTCALPIFFAAMWSEHCSYKHSKPFLKQFPSEGEQVLMGPGEGAGVVDIGDDQALVFKAESHNHPSAVDPYNGAATGVGGIVRDIVSMGARPIGLLNSLRFGELTNPNNRRLLEGVRAGMSDYGNTIGIPTVSGEAEFDGHYDGNPLVNAMCVGLIDHDKIQKGTAKGAGNKVIYVGLKTGRDGILGASFASEELSDDSDVAPPSAQIGDPETGRKLKIGRASCRERGRSED